MFGAAAHYWHCSFLLRLKMLFYSLQINSLDSLCCNTVLERKSFSARYPKKKGNLILEFVRSLNWINITVLTITNFQKVYLWRYFLHYIRYFFLHSHTNRTRDSTSPANYLLINFFRLLTLWFFKWENKNLTLKIYIKGCCR